MIDTTKLKLIFANNPHLFEISGNRVYCGTCEIIFKSRQGAGSHVRKAHGMDIYGNTIPNSPAVARTPKQMAKDTLCDLLKIQSNEKIIQALATCLSDISKIEGY